MKKTIFCLIALAMLFFNRATAQNDDSTMDSVSYSLGVLLAQNLKQQGFEGLDAQSFSQGINDVMSDQTLKISLNDANQVVQAHMEANQAKVQAERAKAYEDKIAKGKAFLAENAEREGVTALPSGLQFEVITAGEGEKPTQSDKVKVHYHGTLLDGTVFDSSVERGEPITFGVTQVIPGWVEALQLMPVGSKWKLFIPYNLAYGERGTNGPIGPYETLIFEVELLGIE